MTRSTRRDKYLAVFALIVLTVPSFLLSCSRPVDRNETTTVEKMLTDAERQKVTHMASGEWAQRWLADDYVVTLADGTVMSGAKAGIVPGLKSGQWKIEAIQIDNVNVRVFGNAAVVTAIQTEKSQVDGKDTGGKFQYTHVWIKRNGEWQIVAGHVTRL